MDTGYCRLILRTRPRNCLHLFYSLSIDLSPVTWAQSNHQGACSTESSTQWLPNVDSLCHAHPSTFIFPHENCLLSRMNLYFLNIWRTVFGNLFYQIKKGKNLRNDGENIKLYRNLLPSSPLHRGLSPSHLNHQSYVVKQKYKAGHLGNFNYSGNHANKLRKETCETNFTCTSYST